ncbi:MAG TPA: SH3 domain-containing protein, partial [Leptospiraceae bacterium]|nr:SH3 domain-containing protein [Leptospiraceae bacterium]
MAYKLLLCLILAFSIQAETRYVVIGSGKLNVREKPVDGKILFQLNKGDKVQVRAGGEDSEWVSIVSSDGKKGFASPEFLSRIPLDQIEKAEMIGVLQNSDKKDTAVLRVIGLNLGGWKGSSDVLPEYSYLGKKIIQDKEKISLYSESGSGVMLLKEPVKWGCQNINGFKGTVNPQMHSVLSSEKGSVLAYYGTGKISSSGFRAI